MRIVRKLRQRPANADDTAQRLAISGAAAHAQGAGGLPAAICVRLRNRSIRLSLSRSCGSGYHDGAGRPTPRPCGLRASRIAGVERKLSECDKRITLRPTKAGGGRAVATPAAVEVPHLDHNSINNILRPSERERLDVGFLSATAAVCARRRTLFKFNEPLCTPPNRVSSLTLQKSPLFPRRDDMWTSNKRNSANTFTFLASSSGGARAFGSAH
ncbi:hypothetical protein EVAR_80378_1 [Eumeta japonica]|uniref:Uncharacterized protein n=1 Tax=Eumeta variegata TaxID=151549 RepID=A0A4C1VII3_EUMVA|nr:hypothetical protein EVAR_80378_1 [Eumeta japonica]